LAAGYRAVQQWNGTDSRQQRSGRLYHGLLLGDRYKLHVVAHCINGFKGEAETGEVAIDGSDLSVSELTLTFEKGGCKRQ